MSVFIFKSLVFGLIYMNEKFCCKICRNKVFYFFLRAITSKGNALITNDSAVKKNKKKHTPKEVHLDIIITSHLSLPSLGAPIFITCDSSDYTSAVSAK